MQKYKVFLNEKRIIFSPTSKITLTKPTNHFLETSSKNKLCEWIEVFERENLAESVIEHPRPEQLFQKLRSSFIQINAAGGVVCRNGKLLFIFRNGKWDLPKGKIDKGESSKEAALREVQEECGIAGHQIVNALPSTYHLYKSPYKKTKGKWIFKETFWYEMEYFDDSDGTPQQEEGITEVRWFKPTELDEVLENTYANLKSLINLYRD